MGFVHSEKRNLVICMIGEITSLKQIEKEVERQLLLTALDDKLERFKILQFTGL